MSKTEDKTKPESADEKFKPANVADGSPGKGRHERNMKDVPRGSEGDRRRSSENRTD
ncbi:hypothetical protein [Aurantiacibacter gilvus]|uniref:Multidrug transporter n=1 Tax=Aurantiacibacter gilvus TaxID=3139141 RepID=A0ABU9IDX0_9SPHN